MRERSSIYPAHFGLAPGAKPLRQRGRGPSSTWDGYVGSQKTNGRSAPFESFLERDLQTHLNADPDIVEYAVQPHRLVYWAPDQDGQPLKRSYTPDAVALTGAGDIVVLDAKAKVFASGEKWRRVEPHIREAYETDHGACFFVLTEDDIRAEPRLTNCQIMLRHRPPGNDSEGELIVRELVHEATGPASIGSITDAAAARGIDEDRTFSALMRMALTGEVRFDHSKSLSPCTAILTGA